MDLNLEQIQQDFRETKGRGRYRRPGRARRNFQAIQKLKIVGGKNGDLTQDQCQFLSANAC